MSHLICIFTVHPKRKSWTIKCIAKKFPLFIALTLFNSRTRCTKMQSKRKLICGTKWMEHCWSLERKVQHRIPVSDDGIKTEKCGRTWLHSLLLTLMLKVTKMKTMAGVWACVFPFHTRLDKIPGKLSIKHSAQTDEKRKTTARFPKKNVFFSCLLNAGWLVGPVLFHGNCARIPKRCYSSNDFIHCNFLFIAFDRFSCLFRFGKKNRHGNFVFSILLFVCYLAFCVFIHFIYSYMANVI